MKTLFDVIVVKRDPLVDRSKGGIILLSEQFKNEEKGVYWGTVLVAGPDCKVLRVGDRVAFARTTYYKYECEDHGEVCGLHEADVLLKLEAQPCLVGCDPCDHADRQTDCDSYIADAELE